MFHLLFLRFCHILHIHLPYILIAIIYSNKLEKLLQKKYLGAQLPPFYSRPLRHCLTHSYNHEFSVFCVLLGQKAYFWELIIWLKHIIPFITQPSIRQIICTHHKVKSNQVQQVIKHFLKFVSVRILVVQRSQSYCDKNCALSFFRVSRHLSFLWTFLFHKDAIFDCDNPNFRFHFMEQWYPSW